jgi:hypothetical protein
MIRVDLFIEAGACGKIDFINHGSVDNYISVIFAFNENVSLIIEMVYKLTKL